MSATDPLARFASQVKPQPNGCWSYGKHGLEDYVTVGLFGRSYQAHRVAWMIRHREMVGHNDIHHKCHNPGCVNPDHLARMTRSQHARTHGQERLPGHLMGKLEGIIDPAA